MRVAIIGQSVFGAEVYKRLRDDGHQIVGVFTVCDDKQGRADVLAQTAEADGIVSRKLVRWKALKKDGGDTIPAVLEDYLSVKADLNVLAFVSQFTPMEVINAPANGSIVYHPSQLPRHRGASAINWTLMEGDEKGGFTIFFADDGLDTGPILLTRETAIEPDDTVNSLYERFMFPEGIAAMGEAVNMIASGRYPKTVQPVEGATYDPIWQKKECGKIEWAQMTSAQVYDARACAPLDSSFSRHSTIPASPHPLHPSPPCRSAEAAQLYPGQRPRARRVVHHQGRASNPPRQQPH